MKKYLIFTFLLFASFKVLSETYICSQELSKFGRTGEIETLVFERDGGVFMWDEFQFQISHESKSDLILTEMDVRDPVSFATVFINKDTKEWGMVFLTMNEFRDDSPKILSYGNCVVFN